MCTVVGEKIFSDRTTQTQVANYIHTGDIHVSLASFQKSEELKANATRFEIYSGSVSIYIIANQFYINRSIVNNITLHTTIQ